MPVNPPNPLPCTAGSNGLALVLLLVSAAIAVMLYVGRESLALVSRLLAVSAVALGHNSVLLALVAGLKAALAGACGRACACAGGEERMVLIVRGWVEALPSRVKPGGAPAKRA